MSRLQTITLTALAAVILGAVIASASGWLGNVVVCGADRSPGCVLWPAPISELVWAGFILGIAVLVIWQVRT
jgi:hypothetical protein